MTAYESTTAGNLPHNVHETEWQEMSMFIYSNTILEVNFKIHYTLYLSTCIPALVDSDSADQDIVFLREERSKI